ncbi:MAG: hypothetical protein QXY89_07165 [Zestosphaera sp.]
MWQVRFETSEKADYGFVINRQLDRVARVRTHVPRDMKESYSEAMFFWLFNYIMALEALYALLIPELKDEEVREMLSTAAYLNILHQRCFSEIEYRADPRDERAAELLKTNPKCVKFREKIDEVMNKYKIPRVSYISAIFYLCDKALEVMLAKLNTSGLLMRGRVVKLGLSGGVDHVSGELSQERYEE